MVIRLRVHRLIILKKQYMYYQAIFLFQVTHGNDLIRFDWLSLWCLMSLSTIFQLYHGGQFYCQTDLR
jgi:hypothetical protein